MPLTPQLLKKIVTEIQKGIPEDKERIDDAARNLEFYRGQFKRYGGKLGVAENWEKIRPRRSLVMQRSINTLCSNLYKDGPKRTLGKGHEAASEWLEWVYRANAVDAILQEADRYTAVSDVVCLQVRPQDDPEKPIDVLLWDSSQFHVWLDPEDQRRPLAVATVDKYDEQKWLRLWTPETVQTYATAKLPKNATAGGQAYTFLGEQPNALGFLPFVFVHWALPVQDFWVPGPGDFLAEMNDAVNTSLTLTGGGVQYNTIPVLILKNMMPGWRPPSPVRPGDAWFLQGNPDSEGQSEDPSAEYLNSDPSFIAAAWEDLNNYINHTLEMVGVPPGTIRMEADAYRSGVAIVAEQTPLILWAKARQRPFAYYEDALARMVLKVGATAFEAPSGFSTRYTVTPAQLEAAMLDPQLTLRWPKMYPDLPGQEQDQADQWSLDNQLTSRTLVIMRRESMTREEAQEYLAAVADDLKREHEMFGDLAMAQAKQQADQNKILQQAEPDGDEPTTQTKPKSDATDTADGDDETSDESDHE